MELFWTLFGLVFVVAEGYALITGRKTLTRFVREKAGIYPYQRRVWFWGPVLGLLFLWLPVHFLTPWL